MTAIEWTHFPGTKGETWDPTVGCSKVSRGCRNCYAIFDVWRMAHHPNPKVSRPVAGLVEKSKGKLNWTGRVRLALDKLEVPFRHKAPRTYFVDSRSDLYHMAVPPTWRARVFGVMARRPDHRFLILTKRPEGLVDSLDLPTISGAPYVPWPLPNVGVGVSVEDQAAADGRIPFLLAAPAALKFLSVEPLTGPVDLAPYLGGLDWVIVGGESKGGDPLDPKWIVDLYTQCRAAGVPLFFKQWGDWAPASAIPPADLEGVDLKALPAHRCASGLWVYRFGKKRAGAQLWAGEVREFPKWELAA